VNNAAIEVISSSPPANGVGHETQELVVRLEIVDPDLRIELRRHSDGDARARHALDLMRLGLQAVRLANGHVDGRAVEDAGKEVVRQVRELLTSRASEMLGKVSATLERYFDPKTGAMPQRIEALVQRDGELERLLDAHLGADGSVLAETLAGHLGAASPILKMLSSSEREGLQARLVEVLASALAEQRSHILREFSLDHGDSALSRLVSEITTRQGELRTDLQSQVEMVVSEFSLDQPNSALSRLVGRVEAAQRTIVDQFSLDNEVSVLSRLSRMLATASDQIAKNLTLDDDTSALSRLRRSLVEPIDEMRKGNADFQSDVRTILTSLQARREEATRSMTHGKTFEVQAGTVLQLEAHHLQDVYEATGNFTGVIKNCKIGDYVIEMGPDSNAPGARIVWETKDDRKYDLKMALGEIEQARKNRQAQVGVFVFARESAPEGLQPFARYSNDIVITWEQEDVSTDLYMRVAYSVARALAIRTRTREEEMGATAQEIEVAVRAIEKQVGFLDEIQRWAETVKSNGGKIVERVTRMRTEIEKELATLDRHLAALEAA